MKKRVLVWIATLCLLLPLTACSDKPDTAESGGESGTAPTVEAAPTVSGEQETGGTRESGVSETGGTTVKGGTTAKTEAARTTVPEVTVNFTGTEAKTSDDIDLWNAKFPGVTIRRLIHYDVGTEEKQMIQDFQSKTGAKVVDVVHKDFNTINNKLSTSMASGDVIDMGFIYGAWYPKVLISNMYQRVNSYIKKENLVDSSSAAGLAKGGFDQGKMNAYKWKGNYYGLCSYWDVDMLVLYYRKSKFVEAGLSATPLQLAQQGKWNLTEFKKAADLLTSVDSKDESKSVYGYSAGMKNTGTHLTTFLSMYGTSIIKYDSNQNPTQNLGDSKIPSALKFIQDMYYGSKKIVGEQATFYNGKAAMAIDGLYEIPKMLADASVPAAVKNDWEIAPLPMADGNMNGAYPTDWLRAYGIIRGSKNPDAVAALALYRSRIKGDNLYEEKMSTAQKERVIPYYKNIAYPNYSYGTTPDIVGQMIGSIMAGGDIAREISQKRPLISAQINQTLQGK